MNKKTLYYYDKINDLRLNVLFLYSLITFLVSIQFLNTIKSLEISILSFFSLAFVYQYNRYTDYEYDQKAEGLKKIKKNMYLVMSLGSLTISFFMSYFDLKYLNVTIFYLVMGVLYSSKTIFKKPIKNYLLLKNIFAAILVPALQIFIVFNYTTLHSYKIIMLIFIPVFLLYLCYEVLWDIKDIESDKIGNVRTLPNTIGKERTIILIFAILSFGALYNINVLNLSLTNINMMAYFIALIFTIVLYFNKNYNYRLFHLFLYVNIVALIIFILFMYV